MSMLICSPLPHNVLQHWLGKICVPFQKKKYCTTGVQIPPQVDDNGDKKYDEDGSLVWCVSSRH